MNKKIIISIALVVLLFLVAGSVYFFSSNKDLKTENNENSDNGENNMKKDEFISKIKINIDGTNYTATLEDNETTREFIKKLPLEISMNELNGNEKYYYFDEYFPSNPSKPGKINNGDIMLYGSDCLVIFYESFNSSYSYTRIGKIDNPSSLKDKVGNGNVKISITK